MVIGAQGLAPAGVPLLLLAATDWLGGLLADGTPAPLSEAPGLRVSLSYPGEMRTDRTETVLLVLSRSANGTLVGTVGTPGLTQVVASPIVVGTPGAPVLQARGTNYGVYAMAQLAGPQMVVSSSAVEQQSLERETLTWTWNVSSRSAGTRRMGVSLRLLFRPRTANAQEFEDQVWSHDLVVEVRDKDVLYMGPVQIPTGSLGQTMVGAGLSSQIPLAIGWLRGRLWGKPPTPGKRRRRSGTSATSGGSG